MQDTFENFGEFIDDLRKSRNISREDFVDNVMSMRQYQRYVYNESSINNDKLLLLIDKLGMSFLGVHRLFLEKTKDEYRHLSMAYTAIVHEDLFKASETLKKINFSEIKDKANKLYYTLCETLIARRTNKIPTDLAMDKLKSLINYPECLSNNYISFIELVSYIEIGRHSNSKDKKIVTNFLYAIIKDNNLSSDNLDQSLLPSIYSTISHSLGIMEEYEKSIYIAQKGIDYCLKHDNMNALSHLFLFKAFGLNLLGRKKEALIPAKKVFSLLLVEDKPNKTDQFTKTFEVSFNMKVSEL